MAEEEDVDADRLGAEEGEGEEMAIAIVAVQPTFTGIHMATVLTSDANVRHQQRGTRAMQPLRT